MTLSIRTKLFISVSSLLLFFVLLSLGLTRLGLEKFYIWQKKDILIESSKTLDELYQDKPGEISLELERIANTLGAGILILNPEGRIKYSPFGPTYDRPLPPPFIPKTNGKEKSARKFPFPQPILIATETIDSQTILELRQDLDLKIDFIILEHQLKNNDILVIRQPLAPISESAAVAAHFTIFTGLLSIFAGCLWAFFFSKKFADPILELNQIAQSMSHLDFSQKCTINRDDEIGELGKSINHLSNQLDTAISELNQKNIQLMADVEKERKLDKMRKDFVSNVSHELKTPLSLILGYAEGLKENVPKDEDSKNYYCSVIIDEAERMDTLVKDLLNLSQIESGFYQLNRTNFDLSLLIHDITQKYLTLVAEKGITLEKNTKTNCFVNGDALRIQQILLNLLNNAIDHAEFAKTIKIWLEDAGDVIRVFIYNSGQPIPKESLEKIWISFYKVDKARTREHGRYGLGLSIVRAIQELHGNAYGVKNTSDGVTFWIDLDKG